MTSFKTRLCSIILIFVCVASFLIPENLPVQAAQTITAETKASELLNSMRPEEKIGQLFLVSFQGQDFNENSSIYELITKYHVGGVILTAKNNNFSDRETTISDANALIQALQQVDYEDSLQEYTDLSNRNLVKNNFIPLFVGISQEGDLYPNDQIINGMTPLPNEMAIGATWDEAKAEKVGNILGKELSTLGVNLLFGPSLDVFDGYTVENNDDVGTRTFGGDPYWVGKLGSAYIRGVHEGSENKIAVIAKNFPGGGGSDRLPEEEVATVRKSLEQLKQIELAPFFEVTDVNQDPFAVTDGLFASHIRYQGFQGNIRATTKPVSFDSAAMDLLLKLDQFSPWRKQGGILISDNLGSDAVRKFFDPSGNSFDARQVARNAFLAGNDILLLDNIISAGDPDSYTTVVKILDFFSQKYREDSAFASLVDAAVFRILTLKYELYPEFEIEAVNSPDRNINSIGLNEEVTFDVAINSATLLSPDMQELSSVLPRPPAQNERIVFLTDVYEGTQCSTCQPQVALEVDSLQSAVLKYYGPSSGDQIISSRMSSYSFSDLTRLMDQAEGNETLLTDLQYADWVVVSLLSVSGNRPNSNALNRLLSERSDLIRNKKVVVFAFNAPYYLDATDISKITAYYALYSKTQPFIDVAARILFQELPVSGALPVSVAGIGYDLIAATSPDPNQIIPIYIDLPEPVSGELTPTIAATIVPEFKLGDIIPLRTGVITDHNGNQVPDGTVARFVITVGNDLGTVQQIETVTEAGIARASYRISNIGMVELRVVSDPAVTSQILTLDVSDTQGVGVTAVVPTPLPTETPQPTITPLPSSTPEVEPIQEESHFPGFNDWLSTMFMLCFGAGAILWFGVRKYSMQWGIRWALSSLMGGLIVYILYSINLVAKGEDAKYAVSSNLLGWSIVGLLVGWLLGYVWRIFDLRRKNKPNGLS